MVGSFIPYVVARRTDIKGSTFEQAIGPAAMRNGFFDTGFGSVYFSRQRINARAQFIDRQGIQILPDQVHKRITSARRIVTISFHCGSVATTAFAVNRHDIERNEIRVVTTAQQRDSLGAEPESYKYPASSTGRTKVTQSSR